MKTWKVKSIYLGLFSSFLFIAACFDDPVAKKASEKPVADVITAKAENITSVENLPGRLEASREAVIIPRVSGIVLKRLYEEGGFVEEGQSLYKLDDGTYKADLQSAEASLEQAKANKALYQSTVNRYQSLLKSRAVSQQDYDQAVANLKAQEANIASAQSAIEAAKINLEYTDIKAPISGIISYSAVTEGAYVTASQTQMATIQQLNPLYINITQSASNVLKLKQAIQSGKVEGDSANQVRLFLSDGTEYPQKGELLFVNQSVNQATGEMTVRASINNPKGDLIPGLYVRVEVPQAILKNAFLIPQQAITRGSSNVLFVVNKDGTFGPRMVTIAGSQGSNWIVTGGIQDGDSVIVDGITAIMMAKGQLPEDEQNKMTVDTRPWKNPLIEDAKAAQSAEKK